MITGAAKVAGVVGWPVAHSLSPLIHNAWIEALGLDAVYVPLSVSPDGFEAFVAGLTASRALIGINVTIPHKTAAYHPTYDFTDVVEASGAANLMLFGGEAPFVDNTDGVGLLAALSEQAPDWRLIDGPVTVLGSGGAATGAVSALLLAGVTEVRVVARSRATAENAMFVWGDRAPVFTFDQLPMALDGVTAVINATSAGLNGQGELPSAAAAPPDAVFMDMVYKPLRTKFLAEAAARGHSTVDGLAMLIGQARPSFEMFFGVAPPPPEVVDVRALCVRALGETA